MVRLPPLAILAALVVLVPGCIGGGDKGADVTPASKNVTNDTPTVMPNGQACGGCAETNKTVNSSTLDGQMHKHDYWHGKETVTIFDADVSTSTQFERGDQTKVGEAFVNLEKMPDNKDAPALVFEGTGKVTFTITKAPAWATSYQLAYRTAGQDWTPWKPVDVGKAFVYEPQKLETDMPHSIRSLWNWKLQATSPVPLTSSSGLTATAGQPFHVTITVQKARDVDSWPPHPAFYADAKERIVALNKQGKTNVQNAADVLIYGVEPDQVVPDKLISMGTGSLDVYVNITQLTMPPGVPVGGFTLFWRTADTRPNSLGIFSPANETDKAKTAHWRLAINASTVDSPYQPTSRFGFKVLVNAADDSHVSCYRCVPYTVEYSMTIVARPGANATAMMT